jgi:hypothetical protein
MHNRLAPSLVSLLILIATPHLFSQGNPVLTWHNDNFRTGQNLQETILTLANVNAKDFGKVGFFATDGSVHAQPLYVPAMKVGGLTRNMLFVASEHDTVYGFGAQTGDIIWHVSLLKPGETTANFSSSCNQIVPEIGVTSTPVIDLTKGPHGAIYVVSMSVDQSGNYHQRLNALDLTTGAQLFGGPTEIQASYPGTGDNSSGGRVIFDPKSYAERAALLEWNGDIYTTWTSHCDERPYTGWVIAFNAYTLKQSGVLNLTPNGDRGAVWMSGAGPAGATTGVLLLDANGTFDTTLNGDGFPAKGDFGNAFIKFNRTSSGAFQVLDYYATDNTVQQSQTDTDLGSGGVLILPSMFDDAGNEHWLAVGAGKDSNIYLVNRFDMGKYHPNGGYIYQVLSGALPNGEWSAPAYFANKIYYGGNGSHLRAFRFSNAKLVSTPASISNNTFQYPGVTLAISANGSQNGIAWAVQNGSTAVLYAYNAEDLSQKLYDSNQSGTRDQFGPGNKFITPTVSNGRVYLGTQTGVAVFGLLGK